MSQNLVQYEKDCRNFMFNILNYIYRMRWCYISDISRTLELNNKKVTGLISALIVWGFLKIRSGLKVQVSLDLAGAIWLKMNKKINGTHIEDLEIRIKHLRNGIV